MSITRIAGFPTLLLGLSLALPAQTVPTTINFQGRLTDNTPQQNPVSALVPMSFAIYDSAAGGSLLWQEPASGGVNVTVTGGIFNYVLGGSVAILPTVFTSSNSTRYLQITLNPGAGNQEILSPRQNLTATGYANLAQTANSTVFATTAGNALNFGGLPASSYLQTGDTAYDSARLGGSLAASWQKALAAPVCAANQFLTTVNADGSSTCGAPTGFSGTLTGDVTGPQAATVVGSVGGQSAAAVAAGTQLANAATNLNTPNTLVKRDASGNFTAGTITASLNGNAATATSATTAASATALAANGTNCPAGQVPLGVDAAGNAEGCGAITETDPKVGSLTTSRLPRWGGATLVNGSFFDSGSAVGLSSAAGGGSLFDLNGSISQNPFGAQLLAIDGTLNSTAAGQAYLYGAYISPIYNYTQGYGNYATGIYVGAPVPSAGSQVVHSIVSVHTAQPSNGLECNVGFGMAVPNQQTALCNARYGIYLADPATQYNYFGANVGIGAVVPGAKLEVAGQVKITGGSPGLNKVLTSDATGLASWAAPAGGIGGSGTANFMAKWTGASALGNSLINDNGTGVGISAAAGAGSLLDLNGSMTQSSFNARLLSIDGTLRSDANGQAYLFGEVIGPTYNFTGGYGNYATGLLVNAPVPSAGSQTVHSIVSVHTAQPSNGAECNVGFGMNVPNQQTSLCNSRYGIYLADPATQYNYFGASVGIGTIVPTAALDVTGSAKVSGQIIRNGPAAAISVNGLFCGATAPTQGLITSGPLTGYRAAKSLCEAACSNASAHMCSAEETVRSLQAGFGGTAGVTYWYSTGVLNVAGGAGDCSGWSSVSNGSGAFQWTNPAVSYTTAGCSTPLPVACCL